MAVKAKYVLIGAVTVLIILCFIGAFIVIKKKEGVGCEIDPFSVKNSPLLFYKGTEDIIYPVYDEHKIRLSPDQPIDLACPGGSVILDGIHLKFSLVSAVCRSGGSIVVKKHEVSWRDIRCSAPITTSVRTTGSKCATQLHFKELEIGFDLGSNRFYKLMQICFDSLSQNPVYSQFNLTSKIDSRHLGTSAPSVFQQPKAFYTVGKMQELYARQNQRRTLNTLLGLEENSMEYIKNNNIDFLARGHLTARADFVYPAQQEGTYYYMNTAPQWQRFNGYNWRAAEIEVREYADMHRVNLQVWTGIYGVATLPHYTTHQPVELYLFVDHNNNKAIPVPKLFWKVVYEPIKKLGVALVGVNNPYLKDVSSEDVICKDISEKLSWLDWKSNKLQEGYMYAYDVNDFRSVVRDVPELTVVGLLL